MPRFLNSGSFKNRALKQVARLFSPTLLLAPANRGQLNSSITG